VQPPCCWSDKTGAPKKTPLLCGSGPAPPQARQRANWTRHVRGPRSLVPRSGETNHRIAGCRHVQHHLPTVERHRPKDWDAFAPVLRARSPFRLAVAGGVSVSAPRLTHAEPALMAGLRESTTSAGWPLAWVLGCCLAAMCLFLGAPRRRALAAELLQWRRPMSSWAMADRSVLAPGPASVSWKLRWRTSTCLGISRLRFLSFRFNIAKPSLYEGKLIRGRVGQRPKTRNKGSPSNVTGALRVQLMRPTLEQHCAPQCCSFVEHGRNSSNVAGTAGPGSGQIGPFPETPDTYHGRALIAGCSPTTSGSSIRPSGGCPQKTVVETLYRRHHRAPGSP
jgi:hypothetical protein